MKILILGAGKMGTFFCDLLSERHRVAVYDPDPSKLRFTYGVERFGSLEEIRVFDPEMVINAATVKFTLSAFNSILPYISPLCMLADIASVKTGLPEFYSYCGHPFVSTHPMFGPTFASLNNLANENAIIISEGDARGKEFFRELYGRLGLNIVEYTFEGHDRTIAYSLSIPFASSLVFASVMRPQPAPGTTFKRHMTIARGLMSEDDYLLSEILFNPYTCEQLDKIQHKLSGLRDIVAKRDNEELKRFLSEVRSNIENKLGC